MLAVAVHRSRQLRQYLRRDVAAHSAHHRRALAGFGRRAPRSVEDLCRLPLTTLADVDDPAALVLRPSAGRRLESRYKPVHWVIQAGVPVGSSATDLDRLARLGARLLGRAGVGGTDVLVGMLPAGPDLAYWQVVLGARHAGVSAIHLPPLPAVHDVAGLAPTVLSGRPLDLVRLLEGARAAGRPLSGVRTLLAVGEHLEPGLRARLASLLDAPGAAVVAAWAPPGVRSLWGECRGGTELHTWPDAEVLELVDPLFGTPVGPGADGEVVWTPLGWHGTVMLRLRTGVYAALVEGRCASCGRAGPRLRVSSSCPPFLVPLDHHGGVEAWQAELRTVEGREELLVFLALADGASLDDVLSDLDAQLSATQYVVLDPPAVDARVAAHGDLRVLDLRT